MPSVGTKTSLSLATLITKRIKKRPYQKQEALVRPFSESSHYAYTQ